MLIQLRKWGALTLMATMLLCQPVATSAQNPLKKAARQAKVSPDLLTILTNRGAPTPLAERGLALQNPNVVIGETVSIEAVAADGNGQELLRNLQALGLRNGVFFKGMVSGYLPIDKIDDLKDVPGLHFARPAYEPEHNVGAVTSQGDKALRANVARQTYAVTGVGSKVGIISDSYNKLGGAAAGVVSGDLPSGVQVLLDYQQPSATDEGRALAELVHDVAPGANLAFHTAQGGQPVFAKGIRDLAAAGCNIIVDDIIYFAEPFFQDGIVAQAADEVVTANNVSYFSAAGNQARSSYQAGYKDSGVNIPNYGQAHDFGGGDTRQRITIPAGGSFRIALQWDDPFFSVSGPPGAQTDLDILVYSTTTGALLNGSFGDNLEGDPFEFVSYVNTGSAAVSIDIAIVKYAGPDPGLLKWVNFGSRTITVEHDTQSSTLYGHSNSARVISVGAAAYYDTPAYNPTLPTAVVQGFSSAGGTPLLFTTTGQRINGAVGVTRQKPDITAVDGVNTTFFPPLGGFVPDNFSNFFGFFEAVPHAASDFESDGFPNFFGTSASAPHAAGVAALMQEKAANGLSPDRVLSLMKATALDMDDPLTSHFDTGFDFRTGYGFIQVDRILQALAPSQPTASLALSAPLYDCATGVFTFQVNNAAADKRVEYYSAPGITDWTTNPTHVFNTDLRTVGDVKPFTLRARYVGEPASEVRLEWIRPAPCSATAQPTASLALSAPLYDCATGVFTFQVNNAAAGKRVEYYSAPGITDWTTNPTHVFNTDLRTVGDVKPFTLRARYVGEPASEVRLEWIRPAPCSATAQPTASLALSAPLYDCATGVFTFQVNNAAADKRVEYYSVPGITDWTTNPTHVFNTDLRTVGDVKPFTLRARYVGEPASEVRLEWIRPAPCSATAQPTASLALSAPLYDCATGVFTFQVNNAAAGKRVEYYSVPGITDWTTNPTHVFNTDLRTVGDVKPFTLRARYVGEPASEVRLEWIRPAPCSPGARMAAQELDNDLQVTVLGNPARDEQVEVDLRGAEGQSLLLQVSNGRGEWVSEQTVRMNGATQRQRVSIGRSPGIYLLQIGSDTGRKTVKILRL